MKKWIFLIFIVYGIIAFGQLNRYIYDYTFLVDSTSISSKVSETMFLDIFPNGSRFYSGFELNENSISGGTNEAKGNASNVNWNFATTGKNCYLILPIFVNYYRVQLYDRPNWKIEKETRVWNGLKIQKATTNFLGRIWTAWFQKDSPIISGPYRFSGLPGLVVKVEDANADHVFTLSESKKISKLPKYDFLNEEVAVPATPQQFKRKWKEYSDNPLVVENQMMESMGVVFNNSSGPAVKVSKEKNERKKAILQKLNNPLEKELFY